MDIVKLYVHFKKSEHIAWSFSQTSIGDIPNITMGTETYRPTLLCFLQKYTDKI